MSYARALNTVDFLLDVLAEAEKQLANEAPERKENEPPATTTAPVADASTEVYFVDCNADGVADGQTVRVTVSLERLDAQWTAAELGENDAKSIYLGCVGKIMEVEEDDDTVQLRWANLNTCWIPIKACVTANGAEPTLPMGDGN